MGGDPWVAPVLVVATDFQIYPKNPQVKAGKVGKGGGDPAAFGE
jgi:hypothetical protein